MNNSFLATQNVDMEVSTPVDTIPLLQARAVDLERIIDAFDKISSSMYWKLLQSEIFDGVLEALERRMRNEKDTTQLFKLQGQIVWADKYSDLSKLADVYKRELINVTKQINAQK